MQTRTPHGLWRIGLISALLVLLAAVGASATEVTRYFRFNGGETLWHWTESGQTKTGDPVTPTTLPRDMDDPAELRFWDGAGTLLLHLRNYRPSEYTSLNDWKTETETGLVAFHLAGAASGTGDLPEWGETLQVTAIGQPTHAPGQDPVGTSWFAQTAYDPDLDADAPRWWCEAQGDAIAKDGGGVFDDFVQYTFDDAAIPPDGTVTLWVQGVVTEDLDGWLAGTAPYGRLEGAAPVQAMSDDDGDGYFGGWQGGVPLDMWDCDDDPQDDPPGCAACACGTAECAVCARCIYVGAPEFPGDGVDSDCTEDPWYVATVLPAAGDASLSVGLNALSLLLAPALALLAWRAGRRRR